MLIRHNQRDKSRFDLFWINVVTGVSERIFENTEYADLFTDSQFQLRLATRLKADGTAEIFERRSDGAWTPFTEVPLGDIDAFRLIDFSADGATLYLIDSRGRDKAALFAFDMKTRESKLLAADDEADIVQVVLDEERRPVAARANRDRARWYAVEPAARQDLADLARHGEGDVTILSDSADRRIATVFYERDNESGEFALLDRERREVRKLLVQRKALADVALRRMQPVIIPSRDGLRLNGYLTLPAQDAAGSGRMPLVLVIHGGPYARDVWGFNSIHQWLANRGYAVLSVNYRGSTGFGKAFIKAADREWGGRMHDDLIDAVDWAVAQGIADPKRVGFYRRKLWRLFRVDGGDQDAGSIRLHRRLFGISNLITFMATIPPYWGPWFSVWKNRLGDPDTETGRAFLAERSPINHLERATDRS